MSDSKPADLLRSAKLVVSPETFHVISIDNEAWEEILTDPALSPLMRTEFLLFKDKWEITLVLDSQDFANIRRGLGKANVESGFRLISFDIEMDFDVVGFMALVAGIMAESGISILPFSSFSRDHFLLRQEDLAPALKAFRGVVDEVC